MNKCAANLTVDPALLKDAKAPGLSLPVTFGAGLRAAARARKTERWLEERRAAFEECNSLVAQNGLPPETYPRF